MAKCQVKIQTQGNQRIYKLGDTIKGEVLVAVNDTCRCKGSSPNALLENAWTW